MIRLVCVNIERSKHLDLLLPFLERQQADVVCIQELLKRDIPRFEEVVGPCASFGLEGPHPADPPEKGAVMEGNAIFTKFPVSGAELIYYAGNAEHAAVSEPKRVPDDRPVVMCVVSKDGEPFRVATIHFTWTFGGEVNDQQREDLQALFARLDPFGEFVLCGDFNAPRGGEIFSALAERYRDNVPPQYTTSIDKDLHRKGDLQLMVDGIFSTPEYIVSDVELHAGVSDHLAITATIRKKETALHAAH